MLRSAIDRAAERFASVCGGHPSRRELRQHTDDLVLDLLNALRVASLAEIAEAVALLTRRRKERPAHASPSPSPKSRATAPTSATPRNKRPKPTRRRVDHADRLGAPAALASTPARTPFDITMPSELLAPASVSVASAPIEREPQSRRMVGMIGDGLAAREMPSSARAAAPVASPVAPVAPVNGAPRESAPTARIALREGEELVRRSGSGVVMRRTRTA